MTTRTILLMLTFGFITANCYSFNLNWAKNIAATSEVGKIALDTNENVFIAYTSGNNIVIAKYDSSGTLINSHSIATNVNNTRLQMQIDASNNIVLSGFFDGTVNFNPTGTTNLTGNDAIFLAKFNNGLNSLIYATKLIDDYIPTAMCISSSGSIYLAYITSISGVQNHAHLSKYSASGSQIWSFSLDIPTAGDIAIHGIDVNDVGEVYISGSIYNTTSYPDFDPSSNTFTNIGGKVFFAKYDTLSNFSWARGISTSDDQPITLIKYKNGKLYLASTGNGDVDPNPSVLNLNGRYFLAQYDANNANVIWGKSFHQNVPNNFDEIYDLKVSSNNVFVAYNRPGYIRYYDESSSLIDTLYLPATGYSQITAIAISGSIIYSGGYYSGIADFDPIGTYNLTASANPEAFLAKYSLQQCSITSEFSQSATTICINDTVFFTNNTVGATSSTWYYDNVIASTSNNYNHLFVSQGQHTVSLVTSNGSCLDTSTVTITVDVHNSLNILNLDSTYCENDPAVTLSATPAGGTFSGPGVSGNIFIPKNANEGENTIWYILSGGCLDSTSIKVTVLSEPCATGIADQLHNTKVVIYPNPTSGEFFISLPSVSSDLIIVNLMGQEIQRLNDVKNTFRLTLDQRGIYFIKAVTGKETVTTKLLVD